ARDQLFICVDGWRSAKQGLNDQPFGIYGVIIQKSGFVVLANSAAWSQKLMSFYSKFSCVPMSTDIIPDYFQYVLQVNIPFSTTINFNLIFAIQPSECHHL
ncbi:hypothetical protein CSKR_203179, partial [Clonorchis sinensis]